MQQELQIVHIPVLVTPLTVTSAVRQRTFKVLLKVVSKSSKVRKMFTLRNLDQRKVLSIEHLKEVIGAQLKKDVIASDFDVGYISGSNMVSIRTQADLSEVWSEIISGKNLILWCDGLKDNSFNKKRKQCQSLNHDENVSDEEAWQAPKSKKKKTGGTCTVHYQKTKRKTWFLLYTHASKDLERDDKWWLA